MSYYNGCTGNYRPDDGEGNAILQPLRRVFCEWSFLCSSSNLSVDLYRARQNSVQYGYRMAVNVVPQDAWMPFLEFGENEGHAALFDLENFPVSNQLLPK